MILEVARGGLADKAGLRRGDVIVRLNAVIVNDVLDFDQRIASTPIGETVNLDVWRILGSNVDAFTIKVALPSAGQVEPVLKSRERQALRLEEAGEILRKYEETAKAAIEKINR